MIAINGNGGEADAQRELRYRVVDQLLAVLQVAQERQAFGEFGVVVPMQAGKWNHVKLVHNDTVKV